MNPPYQVIAIDIGNTRIHIGIIDVASGICRFSTAVSSDSPEDAIDRAIEEVCTEAKTTLRIAICSSVVKNRGAAIENVLAARAIDLYLTSAAGKLPFANNYKEPEKLGSDRRVNALFAYEYGNGGPAIMVSAGSALVVDLMSPEGFCGGAILPGIAMQFRALHAFTDALPDLPVPQSVVAESFLPGGSTESCISGGILEGAAGAVSAIVNKYLRRTGCSTAKVLATGGDWPLLAGLVDFPFEHHPDMTLIGTGLCVKYLG